MNINITNADNYIRIGRQGTDNTVVKVDVSAYISDMGADTTVTALAQRPNESQPYPVHLIREGNTVSWKVTKSDTGVEGVGSLQLIFNNGKTDKSVIYSTRVEKSLGTAGPVPPAEQSWVDKITAVGAKAEADADRAEQSAKQTAEDAKQTAQDRVQTASDRVQTGADRIQTGKDRTAVENKVDAFKAVADNAVQTVVQTGAEQVKAVNTEGGKQLGILQAEGNTVVGMVKSAGTAQVQAITDKGNAYLTDMDALKQSAQTAEGNAKKSATDAQTAQGLAEQAQKGAKDARTGAEGARDTASQKAVEADMRANNAQDSAIWAKEQADGIKADREQIEKNRVNIITNAIKVEASGNPAVVKDSSDNELVELEILGSTTQVQTSGKNLIQYPYVTSTEIINDVTFTDNGDGTIMINGTATDVAIHPLQLNKPILIPKGNYHLSFYDGGKFTYGRLGIVLYNEKGVSIFSKSDYGEGLQIKIEEDAHSYMLQVFILKGQKLNNIIIKPQLEKGEVTTPYEPYTGGKPSPSPDYPQEIVNSVLDEIECRGSKNVFDGELEIGGISLDTGENTNQAGRYRTKNFIPVNPNTTYYFSREIEGQSKQFIWIIGFDKNKKMISDGTILTNRTNVLFSSPVNGIFKTTASTRYIRWYNTYSNNLKERTMVEEGSSPTPYEPFKGFAETLAQIELSKWDRVIKKDGTWYVERNSATELMTKNSIQREYNNLDYIIVIKNKNDIGFNSYEEVQCFCEKFISKHLRAGIDDLANLNCIIGNISSTQYWMGVHKGISDSEAEKILSDCELVYQTNTPTFEPLPPETQTILNRLQTFYPNTVIQTNEGITLNLKYIADTKMYVDNKFAEMQAMVLERG